MGKGISFNCPPFTVSLDGVTGARFVWDGQECSTLRVLSSGFFLLLKAKNYDYANLFVGWFDCVN